MSADPDRTILLTPGPLTTDKKTREAMLRDWGSRDPEFIAMNARVLQRLLEIAAPSGPADFVCVPVQGSGTFAVEATLGTLVPGAGKVLVAVNGAYGARMQKICDYLGRAAVAYETLEDDPPSAEDIGAILEHDAAITHVAMVHCETTSGILNPVAEIARTVQGHGRRLLLDAMSSFGALPLDAAALGLEAVMASANKCLEGVPGVGFAIVHRAALEASEGNAASLSLDLFDQWQYMARSGQWRFTPPTHVLAALDAALEAHGQEGGTAGRGARYAANCRVLVDGMRALGFETYLGDDLQAPIIVTFRPPADANYAFDAFYDGLKRRGCVIYPGKLTKAESFRIGCIGAIDAADMRRVLAAVAEVLAEMGVTDCRP